MWLSRKDPTDEEFDAGIEPLVHAASINPTHPTTAILLFCNEWHFKGLNYDQWEGSPSLITCPECLRELAEQEKLANEIIDEILAKEKSKKVDTVSR